MNYIIVIPSYNREELLKKTTLPLLKDIPSSIDINVLTDIDYQYNLTDRFKQITAPKGIGNVRNFIRRNWKGHKVLMIDDDIDSIDELVINMIDGSKKLEPIDNLHEFIMNCWSVADEKCANLWGVNLYHNAFFCRNTLTTKICYINGSFTGLNLNNKQDIEKSLQTELDHFEDFDFTIQTFIRDGTVLKFNNVCLKTKCFRAEGGIAEEVGGLKKRKEKAIINGKILQERFPGYCTLYKKKKFDVYNLKLKYPKK